MKKCLSFLLIPFLLSLSLKAQEQKKKGLQKITFGGVLLVAGTTSFDGPSSFSKSTKPFSLVTNFSPNICFVGARTYHNLLYGMGNNALRTINGYNVTKDVGVYTVLAKNLHNRTGYAGLGIERYLRGENATFFLFIEYGTNLSPNLGILTIGTHINIQVPLFKKGM